MAVRNPTEFTQWVDENDFLSGKPVNINMIEVVEDQIYILDAEEMVLSASLTDNGDPTSTSWVTVAKFEVKSKNLCGTGSGTVTCKWSAYYSSEGFGGAEIKISSDADTDTASPLTGLRVWSAFGDIDLNDDGTTDTITIERRINTALSLSGNISVHGIAIFAPET